MTLIYLASVYCSFVKPFIKALFSKLVLLLELDTLCQNGYCEIYS